MVWTLDFDDFSGSFCGGQKYPLLKALNSALDNSPTTVATPQYRYRDYGVSTRIEQMIF
jgi:hypothetical protein